MAKAKKVKKISGNNQKRLWTFGAAGGVIGALALTLLLSKKASGNKETAGITFSPTGSVELILKKVIINQPDKKFLYRGIFCFALGALISQWINRR